MHWCHPYWNFSHGERCESVENGVHDRWGGADCGAFADAPDAEGVQFGWNFGMTRLKRRQVTRMRHRIFAEAANQRLAAAAVNHRLHESLTDALGRAAMHLSFDEQRVDDPAAVIHHHVTQQLNVPCLGINLDRGNVRPVGEENVRGIEEVALFETGCHTKRQVVAQVRRGCDLREGHRFCITLYDGKLEAAPPLENGADNVISKLLAQVCD